MNLIVFHHHLRPGGVTDVIVRAIQATLQHSTAIDRVQIVVGSGEGVAETAARLQSVSKRVSVEVVPQLAYVGQTRMAEYAAPTTTDATQSGPQGQTRSEDVAAGADLLADRILARLTAFVSEDAIWWVHNPHLGKNPAFTLALHRVLERFSAQRVVFHIHDFPEAGRYQNLRYLRQAGLARLYPQTPRLRYVCINTRDRDILRSAGIRDAHYLRNPIEVAHDSQSDREASAAARAELQRRLARQGLPQADRVLLYPVRAIRRKNVLETALITRLLPGENQLLVTLPGTSAAERSYSEIVDLAFAKGFAPGLAQAGSRLLDEDFGFIDLQRAADAVVTSSVQEGFGYQFVSPMLFGSPLVARRLPVTGDVQTLLNDHPAYIYDRLLVPAQTPSLSDPRPYLKLLYRERLDRLASQLGQRREALGAQIDALLSEPILEFSFLNVEVQLAVLKDALDPGFADRIAALNPWLADAGATVLHRSDCSAADRLEATFGPVAHAQAVAALLSDWQPAGELSWGDDAAVFAAFTDPAHLRLLYT